MHAKELWTGREVTLKLEGPPQRNHTGDQGRLYNLQGPSQMIVFTDENAKPLI